MINEYFWVQLVDFVTFLDTKSCDHCFGLCSLASPNRPVEELDAVHEFGTCSLMSKSDSGTTEFLPVPLSTDLSLLPN